MLPRHYLGIVLAGCLCASGGKAWSQDEAWKTENPLIEGGEAAEAAEATLSHSDQAAVDEFAPVDGNAVELPQVDSGYDMPGLKIDVTGSSSYGHDSNTWQAPNGPSANLFAFAYGVNVNSGRENAPGGYYGFDLRGQYFVYDNAAAAMGRDPYEQFFAGHAGFNGGFTEIRMDVNYHRNNGNSLDWDYVQRETRRQASHDYNFALSVSRDLWRGSLELGAGYTLRDFDDNVNVGDGENLFGDIAWMTTPSFAPKSETGLGFRFGSDEYSGQPSQSFVTPSLRGRWKLSGKTTVRNSFGYEMRSVDATPSTDSQNFVYDGGVEWAATAKTGVGLGYYRRVQPSYLLNGQDTTTTGAALTLSNQLPHQFLLSTRAGYESVTYFSSAAAAAAANRDDQFLRFALELSHPLKLTDRIHGEYAIFFNYNNNDSNLALYSFEQDVAGIRFGLIY